MKRTLLACMIVALVVHVGCGRKADHEAESPDPSSRPPAVESDAADSSSASRMPPQELTAIDLLYGTAGLLELRHFSSHDASAGPAGWSERQQAQEAIRSYQKNA